MLHPMAKARTAAEGTVPPPRAPASEPPAALTVADDPVIALRGAAVRVAGRALWSGVDLCIGAGEFVAVLGPNGVGKSTMIKVLLGMLPAADGEVRVLGARPGQANHRIGYLPQRRSFDPSMRIRGVDVVRLGLDGDRWGIPLWPFGARRRAARRRIEEVIELVGASTYAYRPIGTCSGGEQQRLLIAQALVRRPELLLLDEPLDSLDLPNQSAVTALISRICHQENVAVVMVAHDVNPILHHLDRVLYLAEGGAASGTPEEVITSPTLTRLYGTPVEVLRTSAGRLAVIGQPEAPALHTDRHADRHAVGPAAGGDHAAG
ncbi:metal ABC transporter ATP-binding protein [Streptomyces inhibens]|uniref:Metal ABC transporter ATP-binding protein n=1 Tax=Streptomyces inhibens TaxID=2293571 RepID=A0A371PWR4_STRIH|nr:metal ABC transporter ATP-binding protein [Streptomyces inhibens]REK86914.1 metal ABC transporter ATP-binding protein [Streptomyces inhibens]